VLQFNCRINNAVLSRPGRIPHPQDCKQMGRRLQGIPNHCRQLVSPKLCEGGSRSSYHLPSPKFLFQGFPTGSQGASKAGHPNPPAPKRWHSPPGAARRNGDKRCNQESQSNENRVAGCPTVPCRVNLLAQLLRARCQSAEYPPRRPFCVIPGFVASGTPQVAIPCVRGSFPSMVLFSYHGNGVLPAAGIWNSRPAPGIRGAGFF